MLVTLHLILKDYLRFVAGAAGLSGLLRQAGHVTAVSSATREEFLGAFPGWRRRSSVVYNGPGEALDSMEAKELKPYILCAARLAPYKGQDILLMAFAQLARERPDLRLVLCGRDQTRGGVSRLIRALRLQDRVVLTGDLPPARVQGLMRGCEFFVLPSRRENFPMAILEAMRAGKAVVASAAGGVPEMLRHGIEGLLAPPGDVESLARSMRELARDLKRRARLGARARKRSRLFTWAVAAGSYRRLYEGLTARARSCAGMRSKK